jgi:very-short-patch-repair endonuclease
VKRGGGVGCFLKTNYLRIMPGRRFSLYNQKEQEDFRRKLRKKMTPAEVALWQLLRRQQLAGRVFRRQFSIGQYVVDFFCNSENLVVELDGHQHFTPEGLQHDEERDKYLASIGLRVLRIENDRVFNNTQQVLDYIESHFYENLAKGEGSR